MLISFKQLIKQNAEFDIFYIYKYIYTQYVYTYAENITIHPYGTWGFLSLPATMKDLGDILRMAEQEYKMLNL